MVTMSHNFSSTFSLAVCPCLDCEKVRNKDCVEKNLTPINRLDNNGHKYRGSAFNLVSVRLFTTLGSVVVSSNRRSNKRQEKILRN